MTRPHFDSMGTISGLMLRDEDLAHLLRKMPEQTNSRGHRRMNVLLLLDDGWTVERLAYEGSEPLLGAAQCKAVQPSWTHGCI